MPTYNLNWLEQSDDSPRYGTPPTSRDGGTNYAEFGLRPTNTNYTDLTTDLSAGYVHRYSQGESRWYEIDVGKTTGLSLTDSTVNEIYAVIDESTPADPTFDIQVSTGGAPSGLTLKLAEVDTSADTTDSAFNRKPEYGVSGEPLGATNTERVSTKVGNGEVYVSQYDGGDLGEQLNNALADLPTSDIDQGGVVHIDTDGSIDTTVDLTGHSFVRFTGQSMGSPQIAINIDPAFNVPSGNTEAQITFDNFSLSGNGEKAIYIEAGNTYRLSNMHILGAYVTFENAGTNFISLDGMYFQGGGSGLGGLRFGTSSGTDTGVARVTDSRFSGMGSDTAIISNGGGSNAINNCHVNNTNKAIEVNKDATGELSVYNLSTEFISASEGVENYGGLTMVESDADVLQKGDGTYIRCTGSLVVDSGYGEIVGGTMDYSNASGSVGGIATSMAANVDGGDDITAWDFSQKQITGAAFTENIKLIESQDTSSWTPVGRPAETLDPDGDGTDEWEFRVNQGTNGSRTTTSNGRWGANAIKYSADLGSSDKFEAQLNWGFQQDWSNYNYVVYDIKPNDYATDFFAWYFDANASSYLGLNRYVQGGSYTANEWNRVIAPLGGRDKTNVQRFRLRVLNSSGSTQTVSIEIDNIMLGPPTDLLDSPLHGVSEITSGGNIDVVGDATWGDDGEGPVLTSPDGSTYRLTVANDGTLSTESV